MISLLVAALSISAPETTVTLVRGGTINGTPVWDVQDATLDGTAPTTNLGADAVLSGGPSRKVLIRFGDIDRVVGPHQRVVSASLIFASTGGDKPALKSIARVLAPWGEGPYQTLSNILNRPRTNLDDKNAKDQGPVAPRGSVTWRQRRAGEGGASWQQAGASGPSDTAPIEGAKLSAGEREFRIEGLGAAVQAMANRPLSNNGFAISFDSPTEVASSQSAFDRPRLEIVVEDVPAPSGPDLSVVAIERLNGSGKLPSDGETATYVAHIKNLGNAPATGFSGAWVLDEQAGGAQDVPKTLAPGEATTISYQAPYRPSKNDHRFQSVGFSLKPKGDDANPRNDELFVTQGAKPVEIVLSKAAAAALNGRAEDWVQAQTRTFNDVYLNLSRFSFAPEGALERVAVQRVVVDDAAEGATRDGSTRVFVASADPGSLMKGLGKAIGLEDRSATQIPVEKNGLAPRGGEDPFPGLMGYGDTRFEGLVLGQVSLPYEPYWARMFDVSTVEATGLLAASDVAQLNAALGGPAIEMPKTVLIRATSDANAPLVDVDLTFFQSVNGAIPKEAAPAFNLKTATGGTVILPSREGGFFGRLEPNGANGVYLVRATANGATAWSWLKAWQMQDAASRGSRAAAILDLRFALPGAPLDASVNLATDRIVTDSGGSLPAKLAALIDGNPGTETELGTKPGDWIEIDLGRDRTIAEVDLVGSPGGLWARYDLMIYATGQRPTEALPWAKELNSAWTFRNRYESLANGKATVAYRGAPIRFRYLRLVNRSGGPGKLSEIRIVPSAGSTTP